MIINLITDDGMQGIPRVLKPTVEAITPVIIAEATKDRSSQKNDAQIKDKLKYSAYPLFGTITLSRYKGNVCHFRKSFTFFIRTSLCE